MSVPFKGKGKVNVDIRDSVQDWAPFAPPQAPEGAPNVVYIVLDDVGYSAMSCYGGPIQTSNIDKIAGDGVRFTQWHTTALCSPTRSTGRNHTRNSMACITEGASGFVNASGTIPPENGMLSEILGERGWNTYMVGKWHLCPTVEMNLASARRNWPTGRGFERWYGFLGAETSQWYPELTSRGIWHDGWKAVTTHPTISGWGNFNDDEWELYHTDVDRCELHNLAAEHLEKLREFVNLWYAEAGANEGFPLDDRSALEIFIAKRPQLSLPRERYAYFPNHAEVPEAQAVIVRGRSFVIGALVDIPEPGAQGVLFSQGSRFGGHALYVKDNRLHYVNSFVGIFEQMIVATEDLPTGTDLILSASFDKDGVDPPPVATGILSLFYGDRMVGQGRIKTQPGGFMNAGEGLAIGRDVGDPVTQDYPGEQPNRFTGGTIKRVAVDVSGEPYIDLERETHAMLMRE